MQHFKQEEVLPVKHPAVLLISTIGILGVLVASLASIGDYFARRSGSNETRRSARTIDATNIAEGDRELPAVPPELNPPESVVVPFSGVPTGSFFILNDEVVANDVNPLTFKKISSQRVYVVVIDKGAQELRKVDE